jgi:hypothetical protein
LQRKKENYSVLRGGGQNDEKEDALYLTEEFEAGVILGFINRVSMAFLPKDRRVGGKEGEKEKEKRWRNETWKHQPSSK